MKKGSLIKRGRTWYAVWHEEGKQRWKSTGKTRRTDASDWLADHLAPLNAADKAKALREAADAAERQSSIDTGKRMHLSEIWTYYTAAPERSDAGAHTLTHYKVMWQIFCRWLQIRNANALNGTMSDITHTVASDYASHLAKTTGQTTYNKHVTFLRMIWKTVNKATGSTANPWLNIARKRSPVVSRRELTIEEIGQLAAHASGEMKILFAIGVYTGMRLTDCATLQWSEVDLAAGLIRKTARKTARSSGRVLVVPIHPGLMPALLAAHPGHGQYVTPALARKASRHANGITREVADIFDAAGIQRLSEAVPGDRVRPTVIAGFHSLRHTFVSICRKANVPLAVVESIVGHSNAAMTRHYTHVGDEAAIKAIGTIPLIGAALKPDAAAELRQAAEPLPAWALAELRAVTADNWQQTRDRLLATSNA